MTTDTTPAARAAAAIAAYLEEAGNRLVHGPSAGDGGEMPEGERETFAALVDALAALAPAPGAGPP